MEPFEAPPGSAPGMRVSLLLKFGLLTTSSAASAVLLDISCHVE